MRRRVAVPGQKLRKRKRDGKKATDDRNGEHKKDHNDKLAARHRFSHWSNALCKMRDRLSVHY
jgi:hypothetical protein